MAKKIAASKLSSHIGYWLRLVSNHVSHSFAKKLDASGVTVAEWVILREMYDSNDTTSPSHVAELTGLTRGAVSKLITRLLDKNLVTRKEATEDRRYQDIQLTQKAISLVPRLASLADQNDHEFFSKLTKADRQQMIGTLTKLAEQHQIKNIPLE